ncbi:glucuronate isomerase [Cohnella cholangitidis]|uniref:Uronate isomerase n=1 Tax=Cohnella cholangitidis TaxID=2598458 RepID=A0A7G5C463_9BACL|nr:glucuronate isomerase [Cohnella cholangitidis]QMV43997.1 glucuronate isomerase [Cohnella cholangitidis]
MTNLTNMTKPFMDDDFMLRSPTAVTLYNIFAKNLPIIDYHCHLSPQEIYENKKCRNLTEVWLAGDHYKWRAMRANGVDEAYITGSSSDYDKFLAYARTVPLTIGNPLYHWTHLELKRYFGIEELLSEKTAPVIWEKVNTLLSGDGFGARDFISKSDVHVICTTDDPTDSLEFHAKLNTDRDFYTAVLPSYRPDKALEINNAGFCDWVRKLESVSGVPIDDYDALLDALENRINFFHTNGCRVSDHALNYVPFVEATRTDAASVLAKAIKGEAISLHEEHMYKTYTLVFLGREYAKRGWVMQYHMNALRNTNTKAFELIGADTGYDSINDSAIAQPLSRLLDSIEREGGLPKTILYSLNPVQNHVIGTMIGNFQGGVAGKIQFGSGWWFNDTKEGMIAQLKSLAELGLLSRFVGMLTDSRSFLSYTRHEYFRRILCNLIAEWVDNGEFPNDLELLGEIIQNICYFNAKKYFPFELI